MPFGAIASLAGKFIDNSSNKSAARREYDKQKEFAQHGVRWKVEDARAAGIDPLVAMGAQTTSYSPQHVGGSDWSSALGQLGESGQNIYRAEQAKHTPEEKHGRKMQALAEERGELENAKLRSELALARQAGNPPAFPSGQKITADVVDNPLERIKSPAGQPHREVGHIPEVGFTKTKTGFSPVQSQDAKERLEEDLIGNLWWSGRNRLLPSFNINKTVPYPAPKGQFWWYSPLYQEYQLIQKPSFGFRTPSSKTRKYRR